MTPYGTAQPQMMEGGGPSIQDAPLPYLQRIVQMPVNPAVKAAAMQEIARRGAGTWGDMANAGPVSTPLGNVASGAVSIPGQQTDAAPAVTPATPKVNPALAAIDTGAAAADATADRTPSYLDQGVPSSGANQYGPVVVNPALAAAQDDPRLRSIGALLGDIPTEVTDQDKWLAAAKGFGALAASKQPGFLGALGEGTLAATEALQTAQKRANANRQFGVEATQRQQPIDIALRAEQTQQADKARQLKAVQDAVQGLPPELQSMALADPAGFFGEQFKSMFAKQQVPQALQEYMAAVQQGYGGTFLDYQKELRAASRNPVSVSVNLPKPINAGDSKLMELGAQDITQAQQILPLFDIAREAAKNFPQSGPLSGAALLWERGKAYLGLPNNADQGEILQSMQSRLGSLQRIPGSGATSDMEMSLYMQAVPGLMNSQAGNLALADIGQKLAQQRIQNYQSLQKYILENGSSVGYVAPNQGALTPSEVQTLKQAAGVATPTPPAAAPDLSKTSDEDLLRQLTEPGH